MGDESLPCSGSKGGFCPRCSHSLKVVVQSGAEVDFCPACHGVWVEHLEEKQVLEIKPESFSLDELNRLRKHYVSLGRVEKVCYVPCPVCKALMNRKIWGGCSGIVVDVCSEHGTWYDAKELEKVKEYVRFGGVEYEKMVKVDQRLSALHSKLAQESVRLDGRIDSAYMRARLWSMVGF